MKHEFGAFSSDQIKVAARMMHGEIHKLLLYKDKKVTDTIFESDTEFNTYFRNLLHRFAGLNSLFNEPPEMVSFLATLYAAYKLCQDPEYDFLEFRRLIMDAHGYLTDMFGEVR